MRTNTQVLIKALPEDKLNEDHYELVDGVIDEPSEGEVLVQTEAFAITAGIGELCGCAQNRHCHEWNGRWSCGCIKGPSV